MQIKTKRSKVGASGLRDHLTQALRNNDIPLGGRLPTEKELMDTFSLSRTTVRKVLTELTMEGMIERQQGRGTFRIAGRKRTGRLWLAGVWFNWLGGPHWGPMIQGIRDEMSRRQYHCVFEIGGLETGDERRGIEALISKELDGFIVAPSSHPGDNHEPLIKLVEKKVPLVLIDRPLKGYDVDLVITHYQLGAEEIVNYLIELGHTRIGYYGIEGIINKDERFLGYQLVLSKNNLTPDNDWIKIHPRLTSAKTAHEDVLTTVAGTRVDAALCRRTVEELLSLPISHRPTAIFAINTTMAEFLVEQLRHHGVAVPNEMSIVAFGEANNYKENDERPFLTTYNQPNYILGEQAARLLIERIENPISHPKTILLQGKLVKGDSSQSPA
ncbi:MAG: GntR family transcriptional regulator [Sedimentisphaerales bacterium]|nr:GntR family transcriptional regulator [Sedimentisphaerales bacterium]